MKTDWTYCTYALHINIHRMRPAQEPENRVEYLRSALGRRRLNLPQLNYFAKQIYAIQRAEQPLAKLRAAGLEKWGQNPGMPEWPCSNIAGIYKSITNPTEGPVWTIPALYRDIAVVEHLRESRDMRAELEEHFEGRLPFAFVSLAVEAGRAGVLRPFGIRPGKGLVTSEDVRYANSLFEIAELVYDDLRTALALNEIAWPCHYCGRLMTAFDAAHCSTRCKASDERREDYLRSRMRRR